MKTGTILVLAVGLWGCGAKVAYDEPWIEGRAAIGGTSSGIGGDGGSAGGSGDGGAACDWTSECAPAADKKIQKVACNDGNPKTVDRCVAVGDLGGVCAHTEAECDVFDPIEVQEKTCDDGDPSTVDRCTKWNACLSKAPN